VRRSLLWGLLGVGVIGAILAIVLLGGGEESPVATPTSTIAQARPTTSHVSQTPSSLGTTGSTGRCDVVDVRVTANGPLDGIGIRFNPEFEVTASFLESGGDAVLHVNTGYTDETTGQWVTYSWIDGVSLPTPEEAAVPNGNYDPASSTLSGADSLHYLLDFDEVASSPITAPYTAVYDPNVPDVTGSVDLAAGTHTFTLTAQKTDVLEGSGCPAPPVDSP
jgi:hypothetical protein